MNVRTLIAVLIVSAGLAATIGGVAAADDGNPAPTVGPVAVDSAPPGYEVRLSGPFASPAGSIRGGTAKCKGANEFPIGGGGAILSNSPLASLASDGPTIGKRGGLVWYVSVVNASSTATSFSAYVVCINVRDVVSGWTNLRGPFAVDPHSQAGENDLESCTPDQYPSPMGSYGPIIDAHLAQVVLHGSHPTLSGGWQMSVDNTDAVQHSWFTAGTCSQAFGAHVVVGPPVSNPPLTQTEATARCDWGVPLSGGIGSNSTSPLMSVNSSSPITGGWRGYENNASLTHQDTIRAYVMCAEAWPG